jgi:hypothetical protein
VSTAPEGPGAGSIALDDPPDPVDPIDRGSADDRAATPDVSEAESGDGSIGDGPTGGDAVHAAPRVPLVTELARVTGLLLVVLLPIHLVTVLLADPTDVDALLERWEDQWWLLADWGFLTVGLAHCLLSLQPRLLALGRPAARAASCPHCGGDLPVADDGFGRVAFFVLAVVTIGLYLAASWAMLRLV